MRNKRIEIALYIVIVFIVGLSYPSLKAGNLNRQYNGPYSGSFLNRVAFPIGGIGAGMICLEGTGALSHVSVRNTPDVFNEPLIFAALCIKGKDGKDNVAKVLEGPIPNWKYFGRPWTGNGAGGTSYGLPRFDDATFLARFPFGIVTLADEEIPFHVEVSGWSPFIPGDADNSSLPVGALEYRFRNSSSLEVEAVFSFNTKNFMSIPVRQRWRGRRKEGHEIRTIPNGYLLWQNGLEEHPEYEGGFAIFTDESNRAVDHCWFRGGWFDPLTVLWNNIHEANLINRPPVKGEAPGASLYVPFQLKSGEEKTIHVMFAWHVPKSNLRFGEDPEDDQQGQSEKLQSGQCCRTYKPWYAGRFKNIQQIVEYWSDKYDELKQKSLSFRDSFYDTNLPDEVIEAVAANLTILKSPTVLRQTNGRLWCFEGCCDERGCCHGSCTHVWNYAQAIPHLFPALERTFRHTEFNESQDDLGHQTFRSYLPIRPAAHAFHAAADGQLGGIMKVYREWRISGDTDWIKSLWPKVKKSLDYCIQSWDPKGEGVLKEPHHNTYDIEYWGPDGHCTSFYLGALTAAIEMGEVVGDKVSRYRRLLKKGKRFMENELFDGEYFIQKVQWKGLQAKDPVEMAKIGINMNYSEEALELLEKEGPKYQYGTGCLSDGILGIWIAQMSGLNQDILDPNKVRNHLKSIHKYNLKRSLLDHANPQRPSFAMGKDGGLLLCTWPKGGMPTLPFVYSNEVWTGIEYQVASHLMLEGMVDEGLEIVRICRDRYNGKIRNPFNEYECGHWYARALSSYGLVQGLTGVRYDAVDKTLYFDSKIGNDFKSFLSTETGWGNVGLNDGKPYIDIKMGYVDVEHIYISGKKYIEK